MLCLWEAGYDAVHTLDLPHGNRITDTEINRLSELETRVVVTKDADFVNSFIVARRPVGRMPVRAIRRMEFIATTRSAERAQGLPPTIPPYARYRQFVLVGKGLSSPMQDIRHQLILGDDAFVERCRHVNKPEALREVSKAHRRSLAPPLDEYQMCYSNKDEAMAQAYLSGAYTMAEIGRHFGVHYITVSRALRKFEQHRKGML